MIIENNIFYVYAWYFKDTDEIFYIGKGKGERYLVTDKSRNDYFKSIVSKYKDNVDVKILKDNLSETDSWDLERKLIKEYKEKGQCKANFHIGGRGGFTGNTPERSKKLSDVAKTRTGSKNPMYGRTHTEEAIRKIKEANIGKKLSPEHKAKLLAANIGRVKTPEELRKLSESNKGKIPSEYSYNLMMEHMCPYKYVITYENEIIYECLGHTKALKFLKEKFNISRNIFDQLVRKTWVPKFEKHQCLRTLIVDRIKNEKCIVKSVSTIPDECKGVE